MKKIVAIILAMAMVLGLCACNKNKHEVDYVPPTGNDTTSNVDNSTGIVKPTREEQAELIQYCDAIRKLNEFAETGVISYYDKEEDKIVKTSGNHLSRSKALEYYYNVIKNAESVDKWKGTEYANSEEINYDRQEVLNSFTILEDVKLYEKFTDTDHVGNVSEYTVNYLRYNEHGLLVYEDCYMIPGRGQLTQHFSIVQMIHRNSQYPSVERVYDSNGHIAQYRTYDINSEIYCVATTTYDEAGKIVSAQVKTNNDGGGDITYTYDDQNRLAQVQWTGDLLHTYDAMTFTYTYDDNGSILREEIDSYSTTYHNETYLAGKDITEYTYDADGNLASGVWTCQEFSKYSDSETTHQYVFTCDEQGRVLTMTITYGDEVDPENGEIKKAADYAVSVREIVYGDWYIYNPAQ